MPSSHMPVRIDLKYKADPKCVMRFVAVLNQDGRLQTDEMYGYANERSDPNEPLTLYPLILKDVSEEYRQYQAEWGYGDSTETVIDFLDRPLAEGQEVERVDLSEGIEERSVYIITSIAPWSGA
ncbi:hypothetical protein [Modicisalibacter xianhensis]|uniref:Uncharacterized protein n=1 Tax=Modicisalibacter xianhensis TaxID=442341 RepID=A0A1I3GMH2_9GAMM|nr:hypothetical protein [Halomonas xianhensis]SFI24657.1 hypothetical protein SAMN04487959_1352 [Halomonas xianhensis]